MSDQYPFFAYLSRMRYINRWLMRNTFQENIQEHSHMVAVLAHALAVIRNRFFGGTVDPGSGGRGGAVPRCPGDHHRGPAHAGQVSQRHPARRLQGHGAGKRGQHDGHAAGRAGRRGRALPHRRAAHGRGSQAAQGCRPAECLVKCLEEQRSGNHEFDAALAQQKAALEAMHCPEADWFMAHCLPCYTQNLDELTRQDG